ncbi:TonB-dependent receptor [Tellurirhabdus rosea]|uniref:TonB-dependent receptor n=1 Tax=Tellurirhabdus rosea TaxID=2674997 RepID=UPI002254C5B4
MPSEVRAQQPGRPTPPRQGEIDNQEITIEKNRKIELPAANRVFNKIPSLKANPDQKKVTYEFTDRPLAVGDPRLSPVALPVQSGKAENTPLFNNYVKLGAGNYGSFLGEAFGSTAVSENIMVDGSFRHLSSSIGPVDGKNSATSENRLKLNGAYLTNSAQITANLGYDRDAFYFYGYRRPREVDRDTIRQTLNTVNFRIGIENTEPENLIDYSLKTGITSFRDRYNASETDWATNFNGSVGITEKFIALIAADAFVTQRTDGPVDNRNLFRVKPTFKYSTSLLTVTAGVNAVNETDRRLGINRTRAFPVVELDVVPVGSFHFFAGVDGDIARNTLRSLLNENRWLSPQVVLANTEKTLDLYGGSKGDLGGGFTYEAKVSYGQYRNFYAFNNTWADTSRFSVLYDGGNARVLNISGQLGYTYKDLFRSTLKVDVYDYALSRLEEAWHRPRQTGVWSNSLIVNKKLFVTTDLYHYSGIRSKNFASGRVVTLPAIWDLNMKIDYFLGKQVSAFVSLNNILGKNYERYLYYPQQGLNFLGGVSYSF